LSIVLCGGGTFNVHAIVRLPSRSALFGRYTASPLVVNRCREVALVGLQGAPVTRDLS